MNWSKILVLCLFVSSIAVITCHPTGKPKHDRNLMDENQFSSWTEPQEPELRHEKQFPNGTVVGRYTYLDKDGNPVQVKYYADEASYGVELKSLKVIDASTKRANLQAPISKQDDPLKLSTIQIPDIKSLPSAPFDSIYPSHTKLKTDNSFEYLGTEAIESNKINRYKPDKSNSDFEVYYQSELKGPKKCGKEKVRVYFDKERKIRSAVDNFDADKYCEQF